MTTDLLAPADAADKLGTTVGTLAHWRYTKQGPPYVKIGHAVRYRIADLDKWIEANTVRP